MYCTKCGTSNEEEARFCSFCGMPIPTETTNEEAVAATVAPEATVEPIPAAPEAISESTAAGPVPVAETITASAPTAKHASEASAAQETQAYASEAPAVPLPKGTKKNPLGVVLGVMSGTAVALFGVILYLLARNGRL